MLQMKKN